ncbi:MAG: peptidoglycan bridge formation glycyltransferase FemA/FemB family protein, partial [Erysipelotrichaceae bacterium]|nr:peptidoglycan bridge formation glycyltransferase FemA/FemB family protein [Erysipelotrichaceae bacterium]
ILRDARDMGYHTVDFFGTEGTVDPSSDIYGIYLFKLRFAGDFDEFLGEFDFVVRPLLWSSLEKLILYRRKLLIKRSLKQS